MIHLNGCIQLGACQDHFPERHPQELPFHHPPPYPFIWADMDEQGGTLQSSVPEGVALLGNQA